LLTAINLTRVFRLVFLGEPHAKTRRAPEAPWTMALPMVTLIFVNLLAPFLLDNVSLLPDWSYVNKTGAILLVSSGAIGFLIGATMTLTRSWSRPMQPVLRFLQDLLSYDFYITEIYRYTVVFAVDKLSKLNAWIDRNIVDGAVNLVGLATMFSGQTLKYNTSGQSQFYLLTIVLGISILGVIILYPILKNLSLLIGQ
jgi:NAD(P)H-quinone oxidoreductase subunit 5